jgi:hypothetical protein
MTIRGGGNPILDMACAPRFRMGPPPRSFAADAYDCIMVWIHTGSTEYKCVARWSRLDGELPSDCLAPSLVTDWKHNLTERQTGSNARATQET